jgi:hypothetical protein
MIELKDMAFRSPNSQIELHCYISENEIQYSVESGKREKKKKWRKRRLLTTALRREIRGEGLIGAKP